MSKLETVETMSKLEMVEMLTTKISCPVCFNSRFEVNLSCEMPNTPCDFHAICKHCNYLFVVSNETKTMKEILPKIQQHLIDSSCPKCGDENLEMQFLCDTKSEDCFFLVRCADKGHLSRLSQTKIQCVKNLKELFELN